MILGAITLIPESTRIVVSIMFQRNTISSEVKSNGEYKGCRVEMRLRTVVALLRQSMGSNTKPQ